MPPSVRVKLVFSFQVRHPAFNLAYEAEAPANALQKHTSYHPTSVLPYFSPAHLCLGPPLASAAAAAAIRGLGAATVATYGTSSRRGAADPGLPSLPLLLLLLPLCLVVVVVAVACGAVPRGTLYLIVNGSL